MDINDLVKLTSRAWALDILAAMHRGVPARQAPLLAACGAGRTAFGASLAHLIELGLLMRNPGHGHPLRPEFKLTAKGEVAAGMAAQVLDQVREDPARALLRKRWTLPVLAQATQPVRFSDLRTGLAPVTDRALSTSLLDAEDQGWILREIDLTTRRPFPVYSAVGKGLRLGEAVFAR
ncbi:transcriptional regulator [Phycobacter sp. K97]|uniref:transcriptional regulator n=1 Tax=Phycobacter sedimenti TaxID=3133977 RepID=UPI00311FD09F